VVEKV
jgi:hypothetical protein